MTTDSRPFRDMAEARRVVADLEAQLRAKDQAMQSLAESSEFFRLLANAHWAVVESCAAEITDLEDDLVALAGALEASERNHLSLPSYLAIQEALARLAYFRYDETVPMGNRALIATVMSFLREVRERVEFGGQLAISLEG